MRKYQLKMQTLHLPTLLLGFVFFFANTAIQVSASNQTGTIKLVNQSGIEKLTYTSAESMYIKLTDSDRNANALTAETLTMLVTSTTEPLGESVTLTETGVNTGIFSGSLAFNLASTPLANGKLDVRKGEKVIVKYTDPADDFGNQAVLTAKVYFDVTILTGTIVESLTKAKSPYLLTGDIIIPQGFTINVEAGTEIRLSALKDDKSSGSDVNRIEIIVNGKFNVNGTAADSVRFTSNADSPAIGDWYGIRYENFNTSSIKYAVMQHATQLISYNTASVNSDTIRVQHCRIFNNGSGIRVGYVNSVIFDVSHNLYDCSGKFVHFDNGEMSDLIMNSNIIKANSDAIYTQRLKKTTLKGNKAICNGNFLGTYDSYGDILLQDNDYEGKSTNSSTIGTFFSDGGYNNSNRSVTVKNNKVFKVGGFISVNYWNNALKQLEISGNDVFAQSGMSISTVSNAIVKNNRLYLTSQTDSTSTANTGYSNGNGCYMSNVSNAVVSDNIFNARGFDGNGISLNQTNALVKNNTIKGFDIGVYANSSFENPTQDSIQYNTITYNASRGVQLDGYTRMPVNYNNIYNNYDTINYNQNSLQYYTTYELYCNTGNLEQIDARFNFWGKANATQMATGANPKNIIRIYDKQDNPLMSFVNYAQWLDRPYGLKSIVLVASKTEICEGSSVLLNLQGVLSDGQVYALTDRENIGAFRWSTGATTASITVTPLVTTKYSVSFTGENALFRDSVTIVVGEIPAPTGNATQYVPIGTRLMDLVVTGNNVSWYDAAQGGNPLDKTSLVKDNATYYASQFRDLCEGLDRLTVKVYIDDPFTLPYIGNGNGHMNIYILDARINGVLLQPGDVVAIYDGSVCTGKIKLPAVLSTVSPYTIVASSLAETGISPVNGYTEDHDISIRLWDASEQIVYFTQVEFFDPSTGIKTNPVTFNIGGQAFVKVNSHNEQTLSFTAGWNIISLNTMPLVTDMGTVFSNLANNKALIKIMDESGRSLENQGVFGGWLNTIGNLSASEGYKVKVSRDTTMTIKGLPIVKPMTIPLTVGWNIISYPCTESYDAMNVLDPLYTSGVLVKAMGESGKSLENLGMFGGWVNSIGAFTPGKGYKVKVNANVALIINETYSTTAIRSALTQSSDAIPTFRVAYTGNGYEHMNIHVVELDGVDMQPGDEIGVFDGPTCVGTAICNEDMLSRNVLSIIASRDDESEVLPNGFTEGHPLQLRISRQGKYKDLEYTVANDVSSTFETGKSIFLRLKAPLDVLFPENDQTIKCYPNPFTETLTILVANPLGEHLDVSIYDLVGRKVKVLYSGSEIRRQLSWDGCGESGNMIDPGLYFVKCNGTITQTVIKK